MTGFAPDWLRLREPADHKARSLPGPLSLGRAFGKLVRARKSGAARLVDLGGGTGSNIRFLAPLIRGEQIWTVWDSDPALLARLFPAFAGWADERGWDATQVAETLIVTGPELALSISGVCRDLTEPLDLAGFDGVSSAALLDLVSLNWCERLADRLEEAGRPPLLFSLVADREWCWRPRMAMDDEINAVFCADTRRDKGFGPALGYAAAATFAKILAVRGLHTRLAESPWHLGAQCVALQAALLDFCQMAAGDECTVVPGEWLTARRGLLGRQAVTIGHSEILASR